MVMAGRSVHLTTLFSWASLNKHLISTLCTLVGEPKSFIVQKDNKVHPSGIRLDFCILIVKIVLNMKPLYSNASELHFAEKCIFVCRIGQVKKTFIA